MPYRRTCRAAGRPAVALVVALVVASVAGSQPWQAGARAAGVAQAPVAGLRPECLPPGDVAERAAEIEAGHLRLWPFPAWSLPDDPTWTEDPFGDRNWTFQYHTLRWALDLVVASLQTGTTAYGTRALGVIRDWIRDNPVEAAPSSAAWGDHAASARARVLGCAYEAMGRPEDLAAAIALHGATLAAEVLPARVGNHVLNQALGLLDAGCVLGRADWAALARQRIDRLVRAAVDDEGVTNEQSVFYQHYNFETYTLAAARLRSCGLEVPAGLERVARMPELLAYATQPDGTYAMLGDTDRVAAAEIPGTIAEYPASAGVAGSPPASLFRVFGAGFTFGRSGWGAQRAFADETAFTIRFGRGAAFHGHADGGSLTLQAWGASLLVDPGRYTYERNGWRAFFTGRSAHNVVVVDGVAGSAARSTTALARWAGPGLVGMALAPQAYLGEGVSLTRRIVYSSGLDVLLVEDVGASDEVRVYRQLWHLAPDAAPSRAGSTVVTHRPRGNLQVRQLAGSPATRIVRGQRSPVQGWYAPSYGTRVAAPVIEATLRGTTVHFVTLLVPGPGLRRVSARDLRLYEDGFAVTISEAGRTERITVRGTTARLAMLEPQPSPTASPGPGASMSPSPTAPPAATSSPAPSPSATPAPSPAPSPSANPSSSPSPTPAPSPSPAR